MSNNITTRIRTHVITSSTTVDFTTGVGSYFLIFLSPEDFSGTGYNSLGTESDLLNTFSTLFARYRIMSVRASWVGHLAGDNASSISYVKWLQDTVTSLETSTGLYTYADGADVAVKLPGQTTKSSLLIPYEDLSRTGIKWMQTAAVGDNVGAFGQLLFCTSSAASSSVTLHLELDFEFQGLLDPNIVTLLGRKPVVCPHQVLRASRVSNSAVVRPSVLSAAPLRQPNEARSQADFVVVPNNHAGPPAPAPTPSVTPKGGGVFSGYGLRR